MRINSLSNNNFRSFTANQALAAPPAAPSAPTSSTATAVPVAPTTSPVSKNPPVKIPTHAFIFSTAAIGLATGAFLIGRGQTKVLSKQIEKLAKEKADLVNKFGFDKLLETAVFDVIKKGKPVAEGLKGKVYKVVLNDKKYAIKVSKEARFNFDEEAELLQKLPENLQDGQNFVAYYKNSPQGNVLVSNFVGGNAEVLNENTFNSFFDTLFEHDKAGILHGDLSLGNWHVNGQKVNFIDYGESKMFELNKDTMELYPDFVATTNLISLEQNGLPHSILEWQKNGSDVKELISKYVKSKASFYEKHQELLKDSSLDQSRFCNCINYEHNLSTVFSNPSDSVLANEFNRVKTLSAFEETDKFLNYDQNPQKALKNWDKTLSFAQEYKNFIQKNLQSSEITADEKTYFSHQDKIADKFIEKFSDWSTGTKNWLLQLKEKPEASLSDVERTLKQNWDKEGSEKSWEELNNVFV